VTADDTCHTVSAVRTQSQTKQAESAFYQITQSEDLSLPGTLSGQVTDKVAVDKPPNDESNAEVASASKQQILNEQQADATLTGWYKLAQQGSLCYIIATVYYIALANSSIVILTNWCFPKPVKRLRSIWPISRHT